MTKRPCIHTKPYEAFAHRSCKGLSIGPFNRWLGGETVCNQRAQHMGSEGWHLLYLLRISCLRNEYSCTLVLQRP